MALSSLLQAANCEVAQKECYIDTLMGNLQRRKQRAEVELQQVNEALEALEKNPEVAKLLELVSRVSR